MRLHHRIGQALATSCLAVATVGNVGALVAVLTVGASGAGPMQVWAAGFTVYVACALAGLIVGALMH